MNLHAAEADISPKQMATSCRLTCGGQNAAVAHCSESGRKKRKRQQAFSYQQRQWRLRLAAGKLSAAAAAMQHFAYSQLQALMLRALRLFALGRLLMKAFTSSDYEKCFPSQSMPGLTHHQTLPRRLERASERGADSGIWLPVITTGLLKP